MVSTQDAVLLLRKERLQTLPFLPQRHLTFITILTINTNYVLKQGCHGHALSGIQTDGSYSVGMGVRVQKVTDTSVTKVALEQHTQTNTHTHTYHEVNSFRLGYTNQPVTVV